MITFQKTEGSYCTIRGLETYDSFFLHILHNLFEFWSCTNQIAYSLSRCIAILHSARKMAGGVCSKIRAIGQSMLLLLELLMKCIFCHQS